MPFEITYNKEDNYVVSTFTGQFTMTVAREYVAALLPILEQTGCTRVLSDSSQAQIQVTSMDIMQFPKMVAASPLTANLKRAVVAAEGSSGYEMYETLSKIQGQYLQVFTNRDEAIAWLMADDT